MVMAKSGSWATICSAEKNETGMTRKGVQHRLTRVFLIQILFISFATVFGVWATAQIIEQVLVKEALIKEADHYWSLYDEDDDQRSQIFHKYYSPIALSRKLQKFLNKFYYSQESSSSY